MDKGKLQVLPYVLTFMNFWGLHSVCDEINFSYKKILEGFKGILTSL